MTSAMNGDPPSEQKLALVREFLRLSGAQKRIDEGAYVSRYSTAPHWLQFGLFRSSNALIDAYQEYRGIWQEEYESHVNWEFTEEELVEIIAFLQKPAGAHFLEGRWRMDAYIETNTEKVAAEIFEKAERALRSLASDVPEQGPEI
jgi:hypothetical protein